MKSPSMTSDQRPATTEDLDDEMGSSEKQRGNTHECRIDSKDERDEGVSAQAILPAKQDMRQ